jgi:hypothetical protein
MNRKEPGEKPDQIRAFRKAARDLEADESEERFDAALKKIAKSKAHDSENRKQKSK